MNVGDEGGSDQVKLDGERRAGWNERGSRGEGSDRLAFPLDLPRTFPGRLPPQHSSQYHHRPRHPPPTPLHLLPSALVQSFAFCSKLDNSTTPPSEFTGWSEGCSARARGTAAKTGQAGEREGTLRGTACTRRGRLGGGTLTSLLFAGPLQPPLPPLFRNGQVQEPHEPQPEQGPLSPSPPPTFPLSLSSPSHGTLALLPPFSRIGNADGILCNLRVVFGVCRRLTVTVSRSPRRTSTRPTRVYAAPFPFLHPPRDSVDDVACAGRPQVPPQRPFRRSRYPEGCCRQEG